jgi:hypothetical protein
MCRLKNIYQGKERNEELMCYNNLACFDCGRNKHITDGDYPNILS